MQHNEALHLTAIPLRSIVAGEFRRYASQTTVACYDVGEEFEYGAVAFFNLQANLKLAIYPRISLAKDSGLPAKEPNPTEFSIGHNVASETEVDDVMQQAENAGAVIVKSAEKTFWGGYAGYFQDPDGHLWEVAWNPAWTLPE